MDITSTGGIFLLAVLVEGTVEYLLSDVSVMQPFKKYVALAFGIVASVLYRVDLLAAVGLVSSVPFVGPVLTGLVIGRGSNYLNDIVGSFRTIKHANDDPV